LEITSCDVQSGGENGPSPGAIGIHRIRSADGCDGAQFSARNPDKLVRGARVRPHADLARRLESHEKKLASHDQAIAGLVSTLRSLMASPQPKRRPIGFVTPDEKKHG
jgi:hypothetical protein